MGEDFQGKETLSIQIPSQIPKAFDYSHLPAHVLRSSAVESLINQNNDLMARLTVSLRRISVLEEELRIHSQSHEKVRSYFENLKDQVLILKEKEKSFGRRNRSLEEECVREKENSKVLKLRFDELSSAKEAEKKALDETNKQILSRLNLYLKYRGKVKKAQALRKKTFEDLRKDRREILVKLAEEQGARKTLRSKFDEQAGLLQRKDKALKESLKELSESYEKKLSELKKTSSEKERMIRSLEEKSKDFEKLYNRKIELQNEIVFEKRRKEDLESYLNSKIFALKKDLSYYRVEFRKFKAQAEASELDLSKNQKWLKNEQEENKRLLTQLENLQILWKENEEKLEKQREQSQALQKLNQKLSLELNESRKKIQELKEITQVT